MPRLVRSTQPAQLGFLPALVAAAPTIATGGEAIVSSANNVIKSIEGVFGSTGRFNNKDYQAAERALGDACLTGVAGGIVDSGRYLLGHLRDNSSNYAKGYFNALITKAEQAYPNVMDQAKQEGPLVPSDDGYEPLKLLLDAKIPFDEPFMGYSTANIPSSGEPPAPTGATASVVAALRNLKTSGASLSTASMFSGSPLELAVIGGALLFGGFLIYRDAQNTKRSSRRRSRSRRRRGRSPRRLRA